MSRVPPADRQLTPTVTRFTFVEIVVHWLTVASFVVALGTGLPLAYPRLFWLTALFGGPQTSFVVHPWAGIAFSIGFLLMTVRWAHDMFPEAGDREWWGHLKDYATMSGRQEQAGRFNGGQKLFFWGMLVASVALCLTGLFVWQVSWSSVLVRTWMRLGHNVGMVAAFGLFLVHAYMGSAMYPGTFASMLHGRVTRGWALLHHGRWYREQQPGAR
jgi:formate dehydrogenase subunit gamma